MGKWIEFIKAHERMILVLAALGIAGFLFNKYENLVHDADIGKNAIAQEQLKQQVAQNQALATQIAAQEQDNKKLVAQMMAQNASLLAAIANRNQQTTQQQQTDQALPLAELAKRWAFLIQAAPDAIIPAGQNLSASEQASRATVQELELVAPQAATIKDQENIIGNKQKELDSCTSLGVSLNSQVAGLNKQLTDQDRACKAQIAVVKSEARKSKIKWFATGIGAGVALIAKFKLF